MTFSLFWADFFWDDKLFGFGLLGVNKINLFSVYYARGEIMIDLLWLRVFER